jgi:pSer/pThr/pTyr-binding forkhead associated (FHA) protein
MKNAIFLIGRAQDEVDIYIDDDSVSSKHAQLVVENATLTIIDLESTNGIFINSVRIEKPTLLKNADKVKFGAFDCAYKDLLHSVKKAQFQAGKTNDSVLLIETSSTKKSLNINWLYITAIIAVALVLIGVLSYAAFQSSITERFNENHNTREVVDDTLYVDQRSQDDPPETPQVIVTQRTDIEYDYSCMEQGDGSNSLVNIFGGIYNAAQEPFLQSIDVSVEDEEKVGDEAYDELLKEEVVIRSGSKHKVLQNILRDLVLRIDQPRGFDYKIHLIEDTILNVFTVGGHIFFYTEMYEFCDNKSEIAAIIGHEIGHNERGHITRSLKKMIYASQFGTLGELALTFDQISTTSFNQIQEVEADYFGMDLVYPTNYKNCSSVLLWKRMSQSEDDFNPIRNIFRSHPYSVSRVDCLNNHMSTNYSMNCE